MYEKEPNLTKDHVAPSARLYVDEEPKTIVEFGQWLKEIRKESKLTLVELSQKMGYSNPYISQIENGKKNNYPSPEYLKKFAQFTNVEYEHLLKAAKYEELALAERAKMFEHFEELSYERSRREVWIRLDDYTQLVTFEEVFKAYGFDEDETEHVIDMIQGYMDIRSKKKPRKSIGPNESFKIEYD